jgi:hypothetical protein
MSELECVVQRLEKLEARNQRLEKQNRRIKLAGVAGLLAVAAVVSMGQVQPAQFDVVRARSFVVDAGGGEVATFDADGLRYWEGQQPVTTLSKKHLNLSGIDLSVTETGDAFLTIGTPTGNAYLTVGQQRSQRIELRGSTLEIVLLDWEGGHRALLSGTGGLRLWRGGDPSYDPRVDLACTQFQGKDQARLLLRGDETALSLTGSSTIQMGDVNEVGMVAGPAGAPSITLLQNHQEIARVPPR